jgi:hypothetical protein
VLPNPADPADPADRSRSGPRRRSRPPAGRRPTFVPSPGLLLLRVAIMALSLTIGIVLLTRGDWVLGLLLVAFAGLRLGMVVSMRRRRRQWREARRGFGRP